MINKMGHRGSHRLSPLVGLFRLKCILNLLHHTSQVQVNPLTMKSKFSERLFKKILSHSIICLFHVQFGIKILPFVVARNACTAIFLDVYYSRVMGVNQTYYSGLINLSCMICHLRNMIMAINLQRSVQTLIVR